MLYNVYTERVPDSYGIIMGNRWVFPDPVFGPTVFSGKELQLIKTAELVRLRDIMQLSTAYIF